MQDTRALKNSTNLSSWRAWEGEANQRSGFTALLGCVFALMLAFVIPLSVFARALGDASVPMSLGGLTVHLGASFGLMAVAVARINAWKRANPWTSPP